MSLLKQRRVEITEEDVQQLMEALGDLVAEKVTEATNFVRKDRAMPDNMESILRQAVALKSPVDGARYVFDALQADLSAILFVASQMVAGRVLNDADQFEIRNRLTAPTKPFGKRWSEPT